MKLRRSKPTKKAPEKPGRRGSPPGEKVAAELKPASFKQLLRKLCKPGDHRDLKARLLKAGMKQAIDKGNFFFWSKLIDLHEADALTLEDVNELVERLYVVVRRHVEQLEGGKTALQSIALELRDLPYKD